MSDFLPNDYEAPQSVNNYMKLQQGENRFRILSKPLLGFQGWKTGPQGERIVERWPNTEKRVTTEYDDGKAKHFWAMVVWNYNEEAIQVLEITQASIQKAILAIARDPDWGDPFGFDIKITRKGEKLETEYSVNPVPHSKVSEAVQEAYMEKPVNLEALFEGEDPFDVSDVAASDDLPF